MLLLLLLIEALRDHALLLLLLLLLSSELLLLLLLKMLLLSRRQRRYPSRTLLLPPQLTLHRRLHHTPISSHIPASVASEKRTCSSGLRLSGSLPANPTAASACGTPGASSPLI